MNKKGLTLVELLAVIAIIAVISIMIIPGIFSIREGVLDSSYENKVSQIVNAAKNYGQEHITELKSPVTNPVESTFENNFNTNSMTPYDYPRKHIKETGCLPCQPKGYRKEKDNSCCIVF